jgi:hypothetical protein
MMGSAVTLVLAALLLPAASFLVIAALPPLRRSGRQAAWFSIACMVTSFAAAIGGWLAWHQPGAAEPIRAVWAWLPAVQGPFATVGVLVDSTSTTMLLLSRWSPRWFRSIRPAT